MGRILLARGVVSQLILAELEADQHVKGRAGECGLHVRLGQRINRRIVFPGAALADQALADIGRQGRLGLVNIGTRRSASLRALLPINRLTGADD